jgi:hypothetical protein
MERIETYNKNATVLPSSSSPLNARIRTRMRIILKPAHKPHDQHNQNDGSYDSVTEHFDFSYSVKGKRLRLPTPGGVQIQCHSQELT